MQVASGSDVFKFISKCLYVTISFDNEVPSCQKRKKMSARKKIYDLIGYKETLIKILMPLN